MTLTPTSPPQLDLLMDSPSREGLAEPLSKTETPVVPAKPNNVG